MRFPFLSAAILFVNATLHNSNGAEDESPILIEQGKISIVLKPTVGRNGDELEATISISYRLRNPSDEADQSRRLFPVATTQSPFSSIDSAPRITVNGKQVDIEQRQLPHSNYPTGKKQQAWSKDVEAWIGRDPELVRLVREYRDLRQPAEGLNEINARFEERIKKHMADDRTLRNRALYLASGDTGLRRLVDFIPEVDPALRIETGDPKIGYLSICDPYSWEAYAPYEKEWREKIEHWFESKPEIAEILPELRSGWGATRDSRELLESKILKHLHDRNGLSLEIAHEFESFLQRGSKAPSRLLVSALYPETGKRFQAERDKMAAALAEWGFDGRRLSPYTGRLMQGTGFGLLEYSADPGIREALGFEPPRPSALQNLLSASPATLLSFEAPLEAGASADVTVEYSVPVSPLRPRFYQLMHMGVRELIVVFPPQHKAEVTIECPETLSPVIVPSPESIALAEGGTKIYTARLGGESKAIHMASVPMVQHSMDLGDYGSRGESLLSSLLVEVKNPTLRPILMSQRLSQALWRHQYREAHLLQLQIAAEHPDYVPALNAAVAGWSGSDRLAEMHAWILEKSQSPDFTSDEDLKRITNNSSPSRAMSPAAIIALVEQIAMLDDDELNLAEKFGKYFTLCQAGFDPEKNLRTLVELAEANPESTIEALRLIQNLKVDKASALPYVLAHIEFGLRQKIRDREVTSSDPRWDRHLAARQTLRTFRSPGAAPALIEFIHATDEESLVEPATDALRHMTLPEHLDKLKGIGEKVAVGSGSAFSNYLKLLQRSDPGFKQTTPLLISLAKEFPDRAFVVEEHLAQVDHRPYLAKALKTVGNKAATSEERGVAINMISRYATADDLRQLTYIKRFEAKRMNQEIIGIIRRDGGDRSLFPLVEGYYLEYVRGRKSHNHIACVDAFAKIGDPRAIPYLREILDNTERKSDAARAIGRLTLTKANWHLSDQNPIDYALHTALAKTQPEEERNAAWETLLAEPENSFRRAIRASPLRDTINSQAYPFSPFAKEQLSFVRRFGDSGARVLLKSSEGCTLQERYNYAALLALLMPGSKDLVTEDAENEALDSDRRATARLSLTIHANER